MPVPNIATLWDLESPYEDVLASYFNNASFGFAQVLTPRSNINIASELVTPRLQIRAGQTGMPQSGQGLQETSLPNGATYLSYYGLGITLDIVTSRSNRSQNHGLMRGAVRAGMLEISQAMNVPYYQTVLVTPQASTQAIDASNDEIQTQLAYSIEAFVKPDSFPNS